LILTWGLRENKEANQKEMVCRLHSFFLMRTPTPLSVTSFSFPPFSLLSILLQVCLHGSPPFSLYWLFEMKVTAMEPPPLIPFLRPHFVKGRGSRGERPDNKKDTQTIVMKPPLTCVRQKSHASYPSLHTWLPSVGTFSSHEPV